MSSDPFDRLPDPILLLILNHISDIRALLRCRPLSKRFNSLVPQADTLLLRVDRVISPSTSNDAVSSLLFTIFTSLLCLSPTSKPDDHSLNPITTPHNSPSRILRGFDSIKHLRIELPYGDLRLHNKGTSIRWVARFGKTLLSCVILAFNSNGGDSGPGGLKARVMWTISALIAASARHRMLADVVREQGFLSRLVVDDREEEGRVVMDEVGLREFRDHCGSGGGDEDTDNVRTRVPAVGMRMRYEARLELSGGVVMEGATLVVVRPKGDGEENCGVDDEGLVGEAFGNDGRGGGVVAEAVERLLKCRTYILEINSF